MTSTLAALARFWALYVPWLVWQLVLATLTLAVDVCTPASKQQPRIVCLAADDLTDVEVALLTSSITITPGTLVLAIAAADAETPCSIFVQGLFGADEASLVADLEEMRDRVVAALRGKGAVA
ncbi:MAG: sodium:proton antiporter [Nocardioides sp.]|nr:sodium:proton antiporter [Nocardioides sp.]